MKDIDIRVCQTKDLPYILDLMRELAEVSGEQDDHVEKNIFEIFEEMEGKPDIYFNVVAEADKKIVGFISVIFYKTLYHKGGTALINELVINHDYRGTGIGRLLIDKVKNEAIIRGMDELEVGTAMENNAAQVFYKKCGFDEEYVLLGMEF